MSTGRVILRALAACGSLATLACGAPSASDAGAEAAAGAPSAAAPSSVPAGEPQAAWWYDIRFQPTAASVRGVAVREIDPAWQRARALDPADLRGRIPEADLARFAASPLSFSARADLDRDGVAEEFFVGVFAAADGEQGRFVAITRNGRPVRHFAEHGAPGFSALLAGDGEVRWYKCMECGEFETITWTGRSYALQ